MKIATLAKAGIGAVAAVGLAVPIAADPQAANASDYAVASAISRIEQASGGTVETRKNAGGAVDEVVITMPQSGLVAQQAVAAAQQADATVQADDLGKAAEGVDPFRPLNEASSVAEIAAFATSGQSVTEYARQMAVWTPPESPNVSLALPDSVKNLPDVDGDLSYDNGSLRLALSAEDLDSNASWWVTAILTAAAFVASIATKIACYTVFAVQGPFAEALCAFIGGFTVNFFINFFIMAADGTLGDGARWQGVLAQSLVVGLASAIPSDWILAAAKWLRAAVAPATDVARSVGSISAPAGDAIRRVGEQLEAIFNDDFVGEVERELARINPGQADLGKAAFAKAA